MKNLVIQNTCYKTSDNPSCLDLILKNCHRSFQNNNVFEIGLSDIHKVTYLF